MRITLAGKGQLRRGIWKRFAQYCKLPEKVALRVLDEQAAILPDAIKLIERSFLPYDQKVAYKGLIEERATSLLGEAA